MYTAAELDSLIGRFIDKKLPREEWTHGAHLAAATWHLWQFPPDDALFLLRGRIMRHNEAVGTANSDTEGFHETLTEFWLKAVRHFIKQHQFSHPVEAIKAMDGTEMAKSDYPLQFWSKEILNSVQARKEWVAPDISTPDWL